MTRPPALGRAADRPLGRSGLVALAGLVVVGTGLATADPITFLFFLSYALVGAVLITHRPANAIGWVTHPAGAGVWLRGRPE